MTCGDVKATGRCARTSRRCVCAVVATQESAERLQVVVEETESRCPVLNLLRDAEVDLQMEWVRDAEG